MDNAEFRKQFLLPREFGKGTLVGDNPEIFDLTAEQRIFVSAWRHACAIPEEVIREFTREWAQKRYDECNFTWVMLCEAIKHNRRIMHMNPELYPQLVATQPRKKDEPVGHFEQGHVPKSHRVYISPLSDVVGYALPRVFLELTGRGENKTQESYLRTIKVFEQIAITAKTPEELLARLAEAAMTLNSHQPNQSEVELETEQTTRMHDLVDHLFSAGVMKEENSPRAFRELRDAVQKHAKKLWSLYEKQHREGLNKDGILSVEELQALGSVTLKRP